MKKENILIDTFGLIIHIHMLNRLYRHIGIVDNMMVTEISLWLIQHLIIAHSNRILTFDNTDSHICI